MAKYWIKNDMIKNETNLNKLITNLDTNSRICWLFQENEKYYISDLETKLLASFNVSKIPIKLLNNSNYAAQVSLKKYVYSSMVNLESNNYVLIFIHELELKCKELVDLKKIVSNMNQMTNGDNPDEYTNLNSINLNTGQINAKLNHINQSIMESVQTRMSKNVLAEKNSNENDLSALIHSMTPMDLLKNCTLEITDENLMDSNRSDDIVLNLNDAFNKKSNFVFISNQTTDKSEINSFLAVDNSGNMINSSSLMNHPIQLPEINTQLSVIRTTFSQQIVDSNVSNTTQTMSLNNKLLTSAAIINDMDIQINEDYSNNFLDGLKSLSCRRLSRCSSVDYMSDSLSVASMNTTLKRKRKLMSKHSKVSDQFENELNKNENNLQMSPRSDLILQSKPAQTSRSSSSSSSSTTNSSISSSLSACDSMSSLSNIKSKSSIFAPKKLMDKKILEKSLSEKKIIKSRHLHNLFSPISKKKLKISSLFETNTNASQSTVIAGFNSPIKDVNTANSNSSDMDLTNINVFNKYKSLNIDESVQKHRKKRLFDPLSHMMNETDFEKNFDQLSESPFSTNKLIVQNTKYHPTSSRNVLSPSIRNFESTSQKSNTKAVFNNTNATTNLTSNNESIPAAQNPVNDFNQNKTSNTSNTSNLYEISKSNLTMRQEAIMNFEFKLETNRIQSYLKKHVMTSNYD